MEQFGPVGRNLLPLLAKANDFSMEELEENRRGHISTRQMGKMLLKAGRPLRAAGMALAAYLLFVFAFRTVMPKPVLEPTVIAAGGAVVAALAALLSTSRKTLQLLVDLAAGRAATAQGRVYGSFEGEKSMTYYYAIKRDLFEVSCRGHAALPNGELYTLHYAPHSRLLLSIEPVAVGTHDPKHAEAFTWQPGQRARAATAR